MEGRRCVIATAAYGSELEEDVQFLRRFRDEVVLSTYAGRMFYSIFDPFYYSWSPGVASIVARNYALRMAVRALLYPLIASLKLSALVASPLIPLNRELAVFVVGAVASAAIGAVYLTLPAYVALRKLSRWIRVLCAALLVSLAGSALAEALRIGALLAASSSLYVVTVIALSAVACAKLVERIRGWIGRCAP